MPMAINVGDLRTYIIIEEAHTKADGSGGTETIWKNILDGEIKSDAFVRCKWKAKIGRDIVNERKIIMTSAAVLTLRYIPGITSTCRILKGKAPLEKDIYDVVDVINHEDRNRWIDIHVKRKERAI